MVTMQDVLDVSNLTLWVSFLISMPVLLTALGIGVVISLFQTVTGVQEMTITFVPKLLAVMICVSVALPWMSRTLIDFTENVWARLGGLG